MNRQVCIHCSEKRTLSIQEELRQVASEIKRCDDSSGVDPVMLERAAHSLDGWDVIVEEFNRIMRCQQERIVELENAEPCPA